jgi:hypothetical protein
VVRTFPGSVTRLRARPALGGPAHPGSQGDELGVFEQHPPAQRLAEMDAETAAVSMGRPRMNAWVPSRVQVSHR